MTSMVAIRRLAIIAIACAAPMPTDSELSAQEPLVKPTKQHELLKKDIGTWHATMKIWHSPDAKPIESKAVERNELLPGGLWLISRFEGKAGPLPFTGISTMGYDPTEKKYVGTWIDTLSPYLMSVKGEYDEGSETMTSMSEARDATTGEPVTMKLISRYTGDDTRVFEMHMRGEDGEYWKMLQIDYRRAPN